MPRLRLLFLLAGLAVACGGGNDGDGPAGPSTAACGAPPWFTVLPVAAGDINAITVFGGLGAPGHTLPTAHAGFYLSREGVPVSSPGNLRITGLRRTRYLASPTRQGEADFAVEFSVCRNVTGWFGHLTSLSGAFPSSISWTGCQTYSTADETVEACTASPSGLTLSAGAAMGTAGMSAALGLLALDFGLLDDRVTNTYLSPSRHPPPTFTAICAWDKFDAANQAALFAKLRDQARPGVVPAGEPKCGTMQVDVAGTAKGVWAEQGVTGPVGGNETRYITLANYPYRPQDHLALSLGPATLGATVAVVPRQNTGRVNRAFEQLTADGTLHCYVPAEPGATASWFIAVTGPTTLRIERRAHAAGASPCLADPSTWAFGPAAVTMVR